MTALLTLLKRPTVIWVIRLTVSAAVLTVLFRIFPAHQVWDAARNIHPLMWLGALVLFLAGHAASAFKWRSLIGPGVPFRAAFQAHLAGLAANLCLPGVAGGDVVRAGAVFHLAEDKSALAMGSLADRLLDTFGLLILSAAGFALVSASAGAGASLVIFAGLALFAAAVVAGFLLIPAAARRTAGWSQGGKVRRLINKVILTAESLTRRPGRLALCLGISLAVQSLFVGINIIFAGAVGVEAPSAAWFYAWSASKIIAIAPISLGGLGVREASMAGLMAPFGAAPAQVIAVGLIWQTVLYASGLLGAIAQTIWRAKPAPLAATPVAQPQGPAS